MNCKDIINQNVISKIYGIFNFLLEPFLAPQCLVTVAKKKTPQAGTQLSGRAALIFQIKGGKQ